MRQPFATLDRVHEVPLDRVAGIDRNVVTALHHARAAALTEKPLARDRHVEIGTGLERVQRRKKPGAAGPEDQNVGLEVLDFHDFSEHTHQKSEGDDGRQGRGQGGYLLLAFAPVEILDHQNAQSAEEMHGEQKHECDFGGFDQRLIAPAQKAFQSRFALERQAERQKMQRQKNRQRQPRDPVHHRRDPEGAVAMFGRAADHVNTTAATARRPSTASANPKKTAQASTRRSLSWVHSLSTLRTPIEAWIETANTNKP